MSIWRNCSERELKDLFTTQLQLSVTFKGVESDFFSKRHSMFLKFSDSPFLEFVPVLAPSFRRRNHLQWQSVSPESFSELMTLLLPNAFYCSDAYWLFDEDTQQFQFHYLVQKEKEVVR